MKVMQTPSAPSTPLFTSSRSSHTSWAEGETGVAFATASPRTPLPSTGAVSAGKRRHVSLPRVLNTEQRSSGCPPSPPRSNALCLEGVKRAISGRKPPHLGPAGVLQLQVLLHENVVDLVENDVHAISAHQRQVPVALQQRRRGGDGYR